MTNRYLFGKQAERQAEFWFLEHRPQSRLLVRNYRWKRGEIDLIFEEGALLVFVEVRACSFQNWLTGPETLHLKKCFRLFQTANHFLSRYRGSAVEIRFDLMHWERDHWSHLPHFFQN